MILVLLTKIPVKYFAKEHEVLALGRVAPFPEGSLLVGLQGGESGGFIMLRQ